MCFCSGWPHEALHLVWLAEKVENEITTTPVSSSKKDVGGFCFYHAITK